MITISSSSASRASSADSSIGEDDKSSKYSSTLTTNGASKSVAKTSQHPVLQNNLGGDSAEREAVAKRPEGIEIDVITDMENLLSGLAINFGKNIVKLVLADKVAKMEWLDDGMSRLDERSNEDENGKEE